MAGKRYRLWPSLFLTLLAIAIAGCAGKPLGYPYEVESRYGVDDPQFARTMGSLLGPLDGGNSGRTLVNGDA